MAQVPDGHCVVSAVNRVVAGWGETGGGGLYVVDPLSRNWQPIVGLGNELTGSILPPGVGAQGAKSVAVRDDGTLYVGEYTPLGESLELHVLTLRGLSVIQDLEIFLGDAGPYSLGDIAEVKILEGGDAIVGVNGVLPATPLYGASLARVSPNGQVTPIHVTPPPSYMVALAVDERRSTIYYFASNGASGGYSLHAVSMNGGVARLIASYPPVLAIAMVLHDDGWLYLANGWSGVSRIDPATGTYEVLGGLTSSIAIAAERATGDLPYLQQANLFGFYPVGGTVAVMSPSGVSRTLSTIRKGFLTDIAVADNPRSRGAVYGGYSWEVSPSPGGLPRVGNGQFGLQLEAPGPTVPGALIASLGYASQPFAGIQLLLDPATAVAVGAMPASGVRPLPIPAVGALVGQTLWLQSFHLEPAGLRASAALQVTVMQ